MTTTDHDPVIPEDILDGLHRAAAAVPTADLHPTGPALRLRSRRRRRRAGIAAVTTAAAVVALVAVNLAPGDDQVATGPGEGTSHSLTDSADRSAAVLMPQQGVELLPDGSTRELPLARPGDLVEEAFRLSDGRLVTLAARDLIPGTTSREDGPYVQGLAMVVAVFGADGKLLGEHDVRHVGEQVRLAGEDQDRIVLIRSRATKGGRPLRGIEISAVDPATFRESSIASVETMAGIPDVAAGRLVVAGDTAMAGIDGPARCSLQVIDLGTKATHEVDLPRCASLAQANLSPDGRQVAVAVDIEDHDTLRPVLYVVDVRTGDVVTQRRLDDPGTCRAADRRMCQNPEHRALVWRDADTVDALVQDPDPTPGKQLVSGVLVPERLRTVTVEVGQS